MAEQQADAQQLIHRFLGGAPLAVIGRLVLLSILVGVILAAVGLDPWNIIESVRALIIHIWTMGFNPAMALALFPAGGRHRRAHLAPGQARQGAIK